MPERDNRSKFVSAVSGIILLSGVFFMAGLAVAQFRLFPYDQIREVSRIAISLLEYGSVIGAGRRVLPPEGSSRETVSVHEPEAAIGEGYYALFGWDGELRSYSVRLFDSSGALAHTWPIKETSFSDKAKHLQNAPHAMELLPDGSLIVSFDWIGLMARVDACGDAIWVRDGFFHHSFSPASDGGIWTWYGEKSAYGQFQYILKFDPQTGKDVKRISLVDDVIKRSEESAIAFSMDTDFPFVPDDENPMDIFHPNDVEELLPELAPAFPQFEAGDLMFSLRELDMVAIISQSGDLKWVKQGPWLRQHDPDFEPDGSISIYDNSRFRPKSLIMKVDPVTRKATNALPDLEFAFKSIERGKHQLLPNGNRLITIPDQGQAIEVAADGSLAVEFNNVAPDDESMNEDLVNSKWVPQDFFQTFPSCNP